MKHDKIYPENIHRLLKKKKLQLKIHLNIEYNKKIKEVEKPGKEEGVDERFNGCYESERGDSPKNNM